MSDHHQSPATVAEEVAAFLAILTMIFCLLGAPCFIVKCRNRNNTTLIRLDDIHLQSDVEVVRESLRNMVREELARSAREMSAQRLQERKIYVTNKIQSKILTLSTKSSDNCELPDSSDQEEKQVSPDTVEKGLHRDPDAIKTREDGLDLCAICLNDYTDGDEISWSQNKECTHIFHRDCVMQWLLTHKECPCCRHVFLESDDDEMPGTTAPHNELYERTMQRGLELLSTMATQTSTNSPDSPSAINATTSTEPGNDPAQDIEEGLAR